MFRRHQHRASHHDNELLLDEDTRTGLTTDHSRTNTNSSWKKRLNSASLTLWSAVCSSDGSSSDASNSLTAPGPPDSPHYDHSSTVRDQDHTMASSFAAVSASFGGPTCSGGGSASSTLSPSFQHRLQNILKNRCGAASLATKEIRVFQKKLREAERLEERLGKGERLDKLQLEKIERKGEFAGRLVDCVEQAEMESMRIIRS